MPIGPGRYNELCEQIREQTKARGIVLLVFAGENGNGFEVRGPAELLLALPRMMREMANSVQQDIASMILDGSNEQQ